jgi:hypothetical protein
MADASIKILNGGVIAGIPVREPHSGEVEFFKKNPKVGGMAAEDNKIIINPFSNLSPSEKKAVATNEAARIHMRTNKNLKPNFNLTPEQESNLKGTHYEKASPEDRMSTIAARILSGDPSSGTPTKEQTDFVKNLKGAMFPSSKSVQQW